MTRTEFVSVPSPVESLINGSTGVWDMLENDDQSAYRRSLCELFDTVFWLIGSNDVDWSCRTTSEFIIELYRLINRLLKDGNDRFILYCPLNLIPKSKWYRQYDTVVDEFIELYMSAWHKMLRIKDIEADFIDGDVDANQKLLVVAEQFRCILEHNGLLAVSNPSPILSKRKHPQLIIPDDQHLMEFVARRLGSFHTTTTNVKRKKWLQWDYRRQTLMQIGRGIGERLASGACSIDSIIDLDNDATEALLIGIGHAIELKYQLYDQFSPHLLRLCENECLRDVALTVTARLFSSNIMPRSVFHSLGFSFPHLDGQWSRNLVGCDSELGKARKAIGNDPELNKVIFPAYVVFGSKLKGYGGPNSDIDLAVFVRPGIADREYVNKIVDERFGNETVQFWLNDIDNNLHVHDFEHCESRIGDSTDAHVLFGGVWEGDRDTIIMLGNRLLKQYCRDRGTRRKRCLGEMERDALQYRLLHRGFERFFVTSDANTFWDHGYRVTASKLYTGQVFIPMC